MAWTITHDALLAELARRCMTSLPQHAEHNRCLEVAAIAAATARELGFHPVERVGWWLGRPHAWVVVNGVTIHSRLGFKDKLGVGFRGRDGVMPPGGQSKVA